MSTPPRARRERRKPAADAFEAEVLPGLAPFARAELARIAGVRVARAAGDEAGADALPFGYAGRALPLASLRTVTAVNRVLSFDVPRPKALLGDAHLRTLLRESRAVLAAAEEPMRGLRLEAAGSDSPVMRRLRAALAEALGLADDPEEGEFRLRLRPGPGGAAHGGWQAAVRLTPRPLSARAWRVCNRPGGLNACVAAAAWALVGHDPAQRVLNAMCGSGTLLVERAALGPAQRLVGLDSGPEALACSEANLNAAGVRAELLPGDATGTPFADGAFDAVVADPPWGDAVGDRESVAALQPAFLREAARLLAPGGRLLVVTHALRAFESALAEVGEEVGHVWSDEASLRVFHGGHRPALRMMRKRPH